MEGYCEEDFNKNILDIVNMSEILHDNFKIHEKNEKFYLSKVFIKKVNKLRNSEEDDLEEVFKDPDDVEYDKSAAISKSLDVISIEYHVVFHPTYQTPALYFIAHTGK